MVTVTVLAQWFDLFIFIWFYAESYMERKCVHFESEYGMAQYQVFDYYYLIIN